MEKLLLKSKDAHKKDLSDSFPKETLFWNVEDKGSLSFQDLNAIQMSLVHSQKKNLKQKDTLLFAEVDPVMTKGRNFQAQNLLVTSDFLKKQHVDLVSVDRGGDITFHGKGQLMIYFIANLHHYGKDLRRWVHLIEESMMGLFHHFHIKTHRKKNESGLWTAEGKIASLGLGCSQWIVYHGVCLNIDVNLDYFSWIYPCGIKNETMASIQSVTGQAPCLSEVKSVYRFIFSQIMKVILI